MPSWACHASANWKFFFHALTSPPAEQEKKYRCEIDRDRTSLWVRVRLSDGAQLKMPHRVRIQTTNALQRVEVEDLDFPALKRSQDRVIFVDDRKDRRVLLALQGMQIVESKGFGIDSPELDSAVARTADQDVLPVPNCQSQRVNVAKMGVRDDAFGIDLQELRSAQVLERRKESCVVPRRRRHGAVARARARELLQASDKLFATA
jgi:hypothetical protein